MLTYTIKTTLEKMSSDKPVCKNSLQDSTVQPPINDTSSEYISSWTLYHKKTTIEPISWNFYPRSLYKLLILSSSTEDEENRRTFNSWVGN